MKRVPLHPKVSLRTGFLRRLRAEGRRTVITRNGGLKRLKPLKKMAKAHRNALKLYVVLKPEFLRRDENRFCIICIVRREHGENILIQLATEIHHWAGRIGRLLCYVPFFRPSCRGCREWPHQHPGLAREYGLLAPPAQWNVFPVGESKDDG